MKKLKQEYNKPMTPNNNVKTQTRKNHGGGEPKKIHCSR